MPETKLQDFQVNTRLKYDVAFSFAGEQREYVERVAVLISDEIRVFYDKFEESELWGKDLFEHLDDVYQNQARYVVMFISTEYAQKAWTRHERKSAQARSMILEREYILPALFDDTELPGLRKTIGFVDCRRKSPEDFSEILLDKLFGDEGRMIRRSEKIHPIGNRILVKRNTQNEPLPGGIIIPDSAKERPLDGTALFVGPDAKEVKQGDHIVFGRWAGSEVRLDGDDLLLIREDDVLFVLGSDYRLSGPV